MAIKNISLADVSDRVVVSSMNTNGYSVAERQNLVFSTASYYLFSINKPAFSVDLANSIDIIDFSPSKDLPPLTT